MSAAETGEGLSVLWAREKIRSLEEARFDRANAATIDAEILTTALDHHIVSRLTSLVAVDITPSRPVGEKLSTRAVPTQLPDGWNFGKLAAAPQNRQRAAAQPAASPALRSVPVPRTASPHIAFMLLGIFMMLLTQMKRAAKWLSLGRRHA